MTLGVHGVVHRAYHILVSAGLVWHVAQHLGDGLSGDGQAVAMQQVRIEQHFHDLRYAAGAVQVNCQIFTAGLEVAKNRCFLAYPLKIVNGPFHISRMGDGQKVQHSVGGAAGGHNDGHGVFDGFARHDVARLDVFLDGFNEHLGRFFG